MWGPGDGYLVAVDAETKLRAAKPGHNRPVAITEDLPWATLGQRDKLNLLPLSSQSAALVARRARIPYRQHSLRVHRPVTQCRRELDAPRLERPVSVIWET